MQKPPFIDFDFCIPMEEAILLQSVLLAKHGKGISSAKTTKQKLQKLFMSISLVLRKESQLKEYVTDQTI